MTNTKFIGRKGKRVIKASGRTRSGKPLVILGLSGENMTRLIADEPIRLDLAELGLPSTVVLIVGGRTEDDIVKHLRSVGLLPSLPPEAGEVT